MATTDISGREGSRTASAAGLLAVLIVIWGVNHTWVKLALVHSGSFTFNGLRFAAGVALLGALLFALRGRRGLVPVRGERWPLAFIGFLQNGVMSGCSAFALEWIEASRTVLVVHTMPIWAMLLSFLLYRERASTAMLLGVVLGLSGLAFLSAPWAMDWTGAQAVAGTLVVVGGTMAWALGAVLYRGLRWESDIWPQVFWQMLLPALALSMLALFERTPFRPTLGYAGIVLYIALVPTAFGTRCWTRALDRIPAATAGQALTLSPLVGVLFSAAMLGEPLTLTLVVSGLLIMAAALLAYAKPRAFSDYS